MDVTSPISPPRWQVIVHDDDGLPYVVAHLVHEWDALAMARRYWNNPGVRVEPRWDAGLLRSRTG